MLNITTQVHDNNEKIALTSEFKEIIASLTKEPSYKPNQVYIGCRYGDIFTLYQENSSSFYISLKDPRAIRPLLNTTGFLIENTNGIPAACISDEDYPHIYY